MTVRPHGNKVQAYIPNLADKGKSHLWGYQHMTPGISGVKTNVVYACSLSKARS
jgi:hypothetical protein